MWIKREEEIPPSQRTWLGQPLGSSAPIRFGVASMAISVPRGWTPIGVG
jgi:hypothetical protein